MKTSTTMTDQIGAPLILLAEDDELVRQVTEETLLAAGLRVVSVKDGEEAQEALRVLRPDLILSDVLMPRCDGFELLRRMREEPEQQQTPFIIMSAKAEAADQRMGMSLGADDYVIKPYDPEDLINAINVRLRRAAAVDEILKEQQRFLTRVLPHELRSPLTGIIGYADLMVNIGKSGEFLSPDDLVDYGSQIQSSGARLLSVADDFSLWAWLASKETAARMGLAEQIKPQTLTADTLCHWCVDVAEKYGRPLDYTLEAVDADVLVPSLGLERVLFHLFDNAFKFSKSGMKVQVTALQIGATYEIVITDSGRGMSSEELHKTGLMRQFRRDKFEQQGMGMGLVLARSFARLAGGFFTLEQNKSGVGLTSRLVLPALNANDRERFR
jgi:CheY-like chemotaxis protein